RSSSVPSCSKQLNHFPAPSEPQRHTSPALTSSYPCDTSHSLRRMYYGEDIFVNAYIMGVMARRAKSFDLGGVFAALADTTRLRLLNLMAGQEVCVCYFVEILKQGQPKISRHLAYLRNAGFVSARREGKWMHYSIKRPDDAAANSILDAVFATF